MRRGARNVLTGVLGEEGAGARNVLTGVLGEEGG